MEHTADLRTRLARARGLGSAHHGVGHWWLQRVTALALVPLLLWFLISLLSALMVPDVVQVAQWFSSPVNTILMLLLLVALFWHARLGMQVIIEDYVHQPVAKYALLLLNTFICWGFAAICILAVLKLHFLDVAASV